MKNIAILSFLLLLTTFVFAQDKTFKITPQDTTIIKKKDESTTNDKASKTADKDSKVPFPKIAGGNFSLWFGNNTTIDISPLAAYKITEKAHIGIGGTYRYYSSTNASTSVYGGRLFLRYMILESIYAHAEYESLSVEYYLSNGKLTRNFVDAALVGATYRSMVSNRFASTFSVLYNTNFVLNTSPYASPLVIRVGFEYDW
jgi:hypothetical protein